MIDLAAIEALGEYVSDCRWSAEFGVVRGLDGAAFPEIATAVRDADAEWIAFFDPPTVRDLITEVQAARTAGDQFRAVLDDLIRWARIGVVSHGKPHSVIEGTISQARRLLGAVQSPPAKDPVP